MDTKTFREKKGSIAMWIKSINKGIKVLENDEDAREKINEVLELIRQADVILGCQGDKVTL